MEPYVKWSVDDFERFAAAFRCAVDRPECDGLFRVAHVRRLARSSWGIRALHALVMGAREDLPRRRLAARRFKSFEDFVRWLGEHWLEIVRLAVLLLPLLFAAGEAKHET